MDNIYEFTDRATIEVEAGEWLIMFEREAPLTEDERKSLQEWMDRSPAHREEINNLASFWSDMNVLTELAVPLGRTESRIAAERAAESRPQPFWGGSFGLAAGVACVAIAIALVFVSFPGARDSRDFYATVVGQQKTLTLKDGSVIQLNTNSQLEVNYSAHYRDIRLLQGEVHFTVAKNPDRPFRVYAGNGRVQAIGTAFAVHMNGRDVDVTVTEGRVGLAAFNKNEPVIGDERSGLIETSLGQLSAGQGTTLKNTVLSGLDAASTIYPVETIDKFELQRRLSWRTGMLKFSGDPLDVVVAEISRYTSISIEIKDPSVGAIRIGGQFRIGDTEAMLESIKTNFGIQVKRINENRVLLYKAKK